MEELKDFSGCLVCCGSKHLDGKIVERTIRKSIPDDPDSTLWTVKIKGVKGYQCLFEDEMIP